MPKGRFPFRRTLEFLSAGRVILKKDVRSVMLSYTHKEESKGLRNFIYKDLPQIQYKNNGVQFISSRNTSEIPKVDIFFGDGRKVLIDVENKKAPEILDIFEQVAGATESELQIRRQPKYPGRINPANFGKYGHCYCICEKPGQVPCPSRVPRPEARKTKPWQEKDS
ncbi:probable 28S ribosomal protein S25, mitochondrial [Exaiptasia diaphana]|uniref:Small ribosomal subunit protein mS25 n=1 Tax=Exaiptasia diaphana TaxID=2652724 RepID=A0A913XAA0_EXADI|nr:probable 28S ribosomal protein S25, mitochondrial [Exaiptasia diaphana]KXJ13963.1 putative 28S ribosomal protein S25, mitochondrial [Exaiptasia diaphana]